LLLLLGSEGKDQKKRVFKKEGKKYRNRRSGKGLRERDGQREKKGAGAREREKIIKCTLCIYLNTRT
jgi:hypothetical protein